MRTIIHPGPVAAQRLSAIAGDPVTLRFTLEPGATVDEAIAKGFSDAGCEGGFVMFDNGRFEPFRYVMPALSSDASHAAWYSATFEPVGTVLMRNGCAIVGRRDDRPFIHCHGLWDTSEGRRMGHMLAPETRVAEPVAVTGIGLKGATFDSLEDPETNFRLFEPARVGDEDPSFLENPVLLARVRPNQDISRAVEEICSAHGIEAADVYGIGSLNEVRFADGRRVDSLATEVLIHEGRMERTSGQPVARLDVAVVDVEGGIYEGQLTRGDNPVLVTFELVIRASAPEGARREE
ncbi:MAG TPA: DUF296 domain-containing protein [Microvirga sp.]|nr:DUF296 domain-containing protein [Microvirga sp.]